MQIHQFFFATLKRLYKGSRERAMRNAGNYPSNTCNELKRDSNESSQKEDNREVFLRRILVN